MEKREIVKLLLKERKALGEKISLFFTIVFVWFVLISPAWLPFYVLFMTVYFLYTPKKKPQVFYFMPLSEKEQKTYILLKGQVTGGISGLLLFFVFLLGCVRAYEPLSTGLAILYSVLIACNYSLAIIRDVIVKEIAERYGMTVSKCLKNCMSPVNRVLYKSMTMLHIIVTVFGIFIGIFYEVTRGIVFCRVKIEAIMISIIIIVLLLLHFRIISGLLNVARTEETKERVRKWK